MDIYTATHTCMYDPVDLTAATRPPHPHTQREFHIQGSLPKTHPPPGRPEPPRSSVENMMMMCTVRRLRERKKERKTCRAVFSLLPLSSVSV